MHIKLCQVTIAHTDADIADCWPVMVQLRPHIKQEGFVGTIRRQSAEGYRLAFIRRDEKVVAVAGFRTPHNLVWGKFCYVDDLVTDEDTRSQGVGAELWDWLVRYARSEGCSRLELDSGVQRFAAHR